MYFSYDYENGIKFHDTADEAKKEAEGDLDLANDHASDYGWDDCIVDNCWGKVSQHVVQTDTKPAPPESEFNEIWHYSLVDSTD